MTPADANPPASLPVSLSRKARRTGESPISYLMAAAVGNPRLISFAAGLVDYDTLPAEAVDALSSEILASPEFARKALQYGTTSGDAQLRESLVRHLCRLEGCRHESMSLTPADVIVTTGSQQAIYLIADVLVDEGDIVIAANPSYFVYTGALQSFGARVMTVPLDAGGFSVDALEALLTKLEQAGELSRVKFVYVQSYHQNPTGITLAADRRERLVQVVKRFSKTHRILILEDAAYRELGFGDERTLPSLKRYDETNEVVASAYTFSKPFAPGLKTGYAFLPRGLVGPILQQKGNHDFGSPNLCQAILREAIASGVYYEHVKTLRAAYQAKRDAMLTALDRHLGDAGLTWTRPAGGLYVWLTLPAHVNTGRGGALFERCLENDVMYVPGEYCHSAAADGSVPHNHIRLCYGTTALDVIEPGIRRLAAAIREQLAAVQSARKSA